MDALAELMPSSDIVFTRVSFDPSSGDPVPTRLQPTTADFVRDLLPLMGRQDFLLLAYTHVQKVECPELPGGFGYMLVADPQNGQDWKFRFLGWEQCGMRSLAQGTGDVLSQTSRSRVLELDE